MSDRGWYRTAHKPWMETAAGSSVSGASVNHATEASRGFVVTHLSGSSDAAGLVTIESPAGTILWRKRFAGAFSFSEDFGLDAGILVAARTAVVGKINATSATNAEINLGGLTIISN